MSKGVHVHLHSENSALDGQGTIEELVARAKELGFPALGLTDHGVCGGIPDFIFECNKQGIKPIPGCEIYVTQDHYIGSEETAKIKENILYKYGLYKITKSKKSHETIKYQKKPFNSFFSKLKKNHWQFDGIEAEMRELLQTGIMNGQCKELEPIESFKADMQALLDQLTFHQVLLAKNNKGLENLYQITTESHVNGFYSKPRISLKYIREHNLGEGIIATSACLGGYIAKLILAGRIDDAIEHIEECKQTFEHYYLEKQATEIPDQLIVNHWIDILAKKTNTKKILTTDVHYVHKEDYKYHDVLVAIGTKSCVGESSLVYAREFWMKSDEEMLAKCNDEEAWGNTLEIADMVDVSLPPEPLLPKYVEVPKKTPEQLLEEKAWSALFTYCLKRGVDVNLYSQRLQSELDVIIPMGFADYFLIVSDYISWAKENGYLVGPGRGSAAGSLVAMCLKITSVDPIQYKLMFERFLSPDRISFPDWSSVVYLNRKYKRYLELLEQYSRLSEKSVRL